MNYKTDFNLANTIWLNCAHQGPLPLVAIEAIKIAASLKQNPSQLTNSLFTSVPLELKRSLAKLINANPDEIILGNSATYTVHLLAQGIQWQKGDEIIVVKGDFPVNILSWLPLQKTGVKLIRIETRTNQVTVKDIEKYISKRSRLLCISWVNSFNGFAIDMQDIGRFCADKKR